MLGTTWTPGRRGALLGASAAVVCLGALLTACGTGGGGGGYVAVGPPRASATAVRPTGGVTLVPLDGPAPSGDGDGGKSSGSSGTSGAASGPAATVPGSALSPGGGNSRRTTAGSPSASPAAGRTTASAGPGGSAALGWSGPVRKATDRRWCEDVTLVFRNTRGNAVRSGTVTLGTHVIGVLGIDWATVESTERLPAPIAAGARKQRTWTVCVDAWRVPLGTHIETRDVSVKWR